MQIYIRPRNAQCFQLRVATSIRSYLGIAVTLEASDQDGYPKVISIILDLSI